MLRILAKKWGATLVATRVAKSSHLKKFREISRNKKINPIVWQKKALMIGLFAGLFSFMGLHLYTFALETGPASIVVPIFSSRNVVVALLCLWYFKEALSSFQKVALGTLLSGLILVSF